MCAWFVLSNKNQHSFFQLFLSSKNKVTRHTAWHNEKNITSEEVQIPFCTQNPLTRSVILLLHSFINMMLSAAEQVLQTMNHCKCSTGWEWNKTFLIQSQWILMVNQWKVLICTTAKPKTFTNAVYSTVLLFSFPRPSLPWQHQWLQDRLVLAGKHDPGGAGRFWVGEDPDPQRQSHLVPSAVDDLFAHWGPGSDRNQCILWNQLHWGPGPDRNQCILWNQVHWDPGSDRNQCKLLNQVHWGPGSDRNQCILWNKYTGALDQTETNAYCENKYTGVLDQTETNAYCETKYTEALDQTEANAYCETKYAPNAYCETKEQNADKQELSNNWKQRLTPLHDHNIQCNKWR